MNALLLIFERIEFYEIQRTFHEPLMLKWKKVIFNKPTVEVQSPAASAVM